MNFLTVYEVRKSVDITYVRVFKTGSLYCRVQRVLDMVLPVRA